MTSAVRSLTVCLLMACRPPVAGPSPPAREGISIALYAGDRHGGASYAVVDQRRWIEVDGDSVLIDHIAPSVSLASLLIEPAAASGLALGTCSRERVVSVGSPVGPPVTGDPEPKPLDARRAAASALRCAVRGPRGRYFVHLLYTAPEPGYRAQHDISITAARIATVASRFAVVTPAWHAAAELRVLEGVPGGDLPPRELARGTVTLDGSTAMLVVAPHPVAAQLRWIYDGAVPSAPDLAPRDPRWGRESHPAVWAWLELDDPALAEGPVHVHVELAGEATRDIDVPAAGRRYATGPLGPKWPRWPRWPLWIDDHLIGKRDRWTETRDDAVLTDTFVVSIANTGDVARDVWIEEPLRPARRHTVVHAWPGTPEIGPSTLRVQLAVPAGKIERAGFSVDYER